MKFGEIVARVKQVFYSVGSGVSSYAGGFLGIIREPFSGAWQRNMECETRENILAFSPAFTAISLISGDISKLRIKLTQLMPSGIWKEISSPSFSPVLRKPNRYQTRLQFIAAWIISKLVFGNTYVLKERDNRNVVVAMYVLDARRVTPLISSDGGVYYQIAQDHLNNVETAMTVPASEVMHDRMMCLFHHLIGISPLFACSSSATQGIRIQAQSEKFFQNMARPSGMLTAPGTIADETAKRIKETFQTNFGGGNIGKTFVAGDGLNYQAMMLPAIESQLIEQLRWTVEDVARCFKIPLHKLGVGQPTLNNIGALNQDYYNQCLQEHIESIEALLDEGLAVGGSNGEVYGTELDLDGLLRMDPIGMAEMLDKMSGTMAPNEKRAKVNLEPVDGGESPYLQQQNFSLEALAKRDALPNPFIVDKPASNPTPSAQGPAVTADPAATDAAAKDMVDALIAKFMRETSILAG